MELPQMLLIGGATRNVGKTSLSARIINKFAHEQVVAIKIKTIYPNDSFFHGKYDQNKLELHTSIWVRYTGDSTELTKISNVKKLNDDENPILDDIISVRL